MVQKYPICIKCHKKIANYKPEDGAATCLNVKCGTTTKKKYIKYGILVKFLFDTDNNNLSLTMFKKLLQLDDLYVSKSNGNFVEVVTLGYININKECFKYRRRITLHPKFNAAAHRHQLVLGGYNEQAYHQCTI